MPSQHMKKRKKSHMPEQLPCNICDVCKLLLASATIAAHAVTVGPMHGTSNTSQYLIAASTVQHQLPAVTGSPKIGCARAHAQKHAAPIKYITAVSLNSVVKLPVASYSTPAACTPTMPANEPNVLQRPNNLPESFGAMSDMLATKPAWPSDCMPSAATKRAQAVVEVMPGAVKLIIAAAGAKKANTWMPLRTRSTYTAL